MALASQPDSPIPATDAEPTATAVREQLRRLVGHALFTNSKRYPVLLAYIVEQTLQGNADLLKERTIGVEAFGRKPEYDVNLDPVVRTTAAEVRKRLALYYYSPDHGGELIIELPIGSYVPSFRSVDLRAASEATEQGGGDPAARTGGVAWRDAAGVPAWRLATRRRLLVAGALLLAVVAGFGLGRLQLFPRASSVERFWAPIVNTAGKVTYCLGEPGRPGTVAAGPPSWPGLERRLYVSDVATLARSLAPIVPRNVPFRVVTVSETDYSQLREGPFVLIGAFDNGWTLRLTQGLPFGFEFDATGGRIVDRNGVGRKAWSARRAGPGQPLEHDYAIVARFHDKVTGQPVIVLAGILGQGSQAAGELVSSPVYLDALLHKAPANWDQLNLEAVIGTRVIDGHPGPPTVEAVVTW